MLNIYSIYPYIISYIETEDHHKYTCKSKKYMRDNKLKSMYISFRYKTVFNNKAKVVAI